MRTHLGKPNIEVGQSGSDRKKNKADIATTYCFGMFEAYFFGHGFWVVNFNNSGKSLVNCTPSFDGVHAVRSAGELRFAEEIAVFVVVVVLSGPHWRCEP